MAYVGEVGMVLENHTKVLVGNLEVVLLPGGISARRQFSNRGRPVGPRARFGALVVDLLRFSL